MAMLNKTRRCMQALLTAAPTTRTRCSGDTIMLYAAKANTIRSICESLRAQKVDITKGEPGDRADAAHRIHLRRARRPVPYNCWPRGANPNRDGPPGKHAAHVAAKINASQFVLDLLNAGRRSHARNRQGHTFQLYMNMTPATCAYRGRAAPNGKPWWRGFAPQWQVEDAQGKPG